MAVLSDNDILNIKDIIIPFNEKQVKEVDGNKVISYGLSSYGYDIRCSNKFKVFHSLQRDIIDPKSFDDTVFTVYENVESIVIPPNSFALTESYEWFNIPRGVLGVCLGKSTYARCGIVVNITPLEPEWRGILTIEISNTTPNPVKIYSNEGIAQLLFITGSSICRTSYADKKGKYQNQLGIVSAKV